VSIVLTDTEYQELKEIHRTVHFKSSFKPFSDHLGLRPGEVHTIVASKGSGKSTLARTMVSELVFGGHKVFYYLSEESKNKYFAGLQTMFRDMAPNTHEKYLSNIFAMSELDERLNPQLVLKRLKDEVHLNDCNVLIFDNITTSVCGDGRPDQQSAFYWQLKKLAEDLNIPIVVFVHTEKKTDTRNKFQTGDNVRGNAAIVNLASYCYILTLYYNQNPMRTFLFTDKSRYHPKANKKIYELEYNELYGTFHDAIESNIEVMMEAATAGKSGGKSGF